MEKTLLIDGKPVRFKATAALPRLYRMKFHRDIIQDFQKLQKAHKKLAENQNKRFEIADLETFENCAYMMAKHADPKRVPDSVMEWMEQFNVFSIYEVLPEIFELWRLNELTLAEGKKKFGRLTGN